MTRQLGLTGAIDYGSPAAEHPLNRGLVSWYLQLPLNRGSRRLMDLCRRNPATLVNSPSWRGQAGRPGGFGSLYCSQASTQYAEATGFAFLSSFTVALWVYPQHTVNSDKYYNWVSRGSVFDSNTNFSIGSRYQWTGGSLRAFCYWRNGATLYGNEGPDSQVRLDVWDHWAFAVDGSANLTAYRNGASNFTDTGNSAPADGSQALRIGFPTTVSATEDGSTSFFDDIRVYNRALDAGEASALYRESRLGHPSTLRRLSRRGWFLPAGAAAGIGSVHELHAGGLNAGTRWEMR